MTRILRAGVGIDTEALPADEVVSGSPAAGALAFTEVGGVEVGLWQMTEGVARDTEVDEAFVVLSGRAVIRFLDSDETLEVAAGDLVRLHAGERTEWEVRERLTKVYVA